MDGGPLTRARSREGRQQLTNVFTLRSLAAEPAQETGNPGPQVDEEANGSPCLRQGNRVIQKHQSLSFITLCVLEHGLKRQDFYQVAGVMGGLGEMTQLRQERAGFALTAWRAQ